MLEKMQKVLIVGSKNDSRYYFLIMMQRGKKIAKTTLKVAIIGATIGGVLGYGYLQYINSSIGPLNINYDNAMMYYKDRFKMTDF